MEIKEARHFNEFWPVYVSFHRDPRNRLLHFIGTALAFMCLFAAAIREDFRFLLAAPVLGYGFAWIGHFFLEHNRPATFSAPWFSLLADWKMFYLMINGKMAAEVERVVENER